MIQQKNFNSLQPEEQTKYSMAAATAAKAIFPLEPQLRYGKGLLELSINIDRAAQGIDGDVRNVMIIRYLSSYESWELGSLASITMRPLNTHVLRSKMTLAPTGLECHALVTFKTKWKK